MAVPLDPDMPRALEEPSAEPFIESDELRDMAEHVMAEYSEFRAINDAVRESELVLTYVWETKPWSDEEELKPHTIAKVTKASPLWRCIARIHVAMQFRQWFWDHFDERQREAVVYHELCHLELDRDKGGNLKVVLREHDLEEFAGVMRRFGPIIPGRRAFVKAYLDWQHAQERPDPVQLRALEQDGEQDQ